MDGALASGEHACVSNAPVQSRRSFTDRNQIVVLTTPPVSLTFGVIRLGERKMLAAGPRRLGCHFLGWTTCWLPGGTLRSHELAPVRDAAGARQRRSQRELVIASLLRHPSGERRGIARGRGVPR